MSHTPPLGADQMKELSRLWDEAQDIDVPQRVAWLANAPVSSPAVREALAAMLGAPTESGRNAMSVPRDEQFLAGMERLMSGLRAEAQEDSDGARVGPYRLVRELGFGGMATVWLAERADGLMQRTVAIKLPHAWLGARFLERFDQERQILATLTHPNIARLYDAGLTAGGRPYLALEYIEGESLTAYCTQHALPLRSRLMLFLQVLGTVQFAHDHHVVHRDLKPSNVLVSADGQVHLLDFGIAKLLAENGNDVAVTQLGDIALTPAFAAPEQLTGARVGPLSDVYTLGVLLYTLLADRPPYSMDWPTRASLEKSVLEDPVRKPSEVAARDARALRGDLDTIVMTAMQREPQRRFLSALAFADDIRRHLAGERVRSRPDRLGYVALRFVRRYRLAVASTALVVASLGGGLIAAYRSAQEAREQQHIAAQNARTASEVVNFLEGLFKGNELAFDAKRKPGDITARELLDAGAARIDESLKDAPEAKVRLLGVVASLYSQEQDAQAKSKEMYRNRLALARTLKATDGRLLVDAMLDYANIQLAGDDGGSARALLEEAGTVLDKIKPALPGDGELRGRLELELAYMLQQTDPPMAIRHAERAVELLRPFEHFDGYATALSFLGDEQAGRLEFTKAMATLTEALRVAPTASMQRVEMLSQRCHARTRSGESEAAIPDCQQAFDVAKRLLGDANGDTAYYARRLAEARATAGQAAPAREFLLGLLPALRSVTAEDRRRDLGAMYVSLASIETRLGRPDAARAWLHRLEALHLDTGKVEGGVVLILPEAPEAQAAVAQGRFEDALSVADKGLEVARSRDLSKSLYAHELRIAKVQAVLGRDGAEAAETALRQMIPEEQWPAGEPAHPQSPFDLDRQLLQAQLALARGRQQEAQGLAADLRRRIDDRHAAKELASWSIPAEIVLGKIEFAAGHADAAARHFIQAAAWAPAKGEASLISAEIAAWQARAQLALGDVASAQSLAAAARTIVLQQGTASAVYLEPLQAVQRALALVRIRPEVGSAVDMRALSR